MDITRYNCMQSGMIKPYFCSSIFCTFHFTFISSLIHLNKHHVITKSSLAYWLLTYLPRTVLLMIPTATVCLISRTAKRPRGGY